MLLVTPVGWGGIHGGLQGKAYGLIGSWGILECRSHGLSCLWVSSGGCCLLGTLKQTETGKLSSEVSWMVGPLLRCFP
jgi:hypothetical protein